MGGRGSASGTSVSGKPYGSEYKTVFVVDDIKYVKVREGAAATPMETMSADEYRKYVTIGRNDSLKSITIYDKNGRLKRQIDLDHQHNGKSPHAHSGYPDERKDAVLSKADTELIRKVEVAWAKYKS